MTKTMWSTIIRNLNGESEWKDCNYQDPRFAFPHLLQQIYFNTFYNPCIFIWPLREATKQIFTASSQAFKFPSSKPFLNTWENVLAYKRGMNANARQNTTNHVQWRAVRFPASCAPLWSVHESGSEMLNKFHALYCNWESRRMRSIESSLLLWETDSVWIAELTWRANTKYAAAILIATAKKYREEKTNKNKSLTVLA